MFVSDLQLTDNQKSDGYAKAFNIGKALQKAYYGDTDDLPPYALVGSWGKQTQVRPPRDLDMFFVLPWQEKVRFDARTGNVQSQLLQEVKDVLAKPYSQTTMRGDGQVVVVAFNTITVEVVPVFRLVTGQFVMPDTNGGGQWKTVDPAAQIAKIDNADKALNGNVRAMSQIMKLWKYEKNVPLKSFVIELLMADFLLQRGSGHYDTYWYDFYVRDFLWFLKQKANQFIVIPGTGDLYFLGDAWLSRTQTAYDCALQACKYEYDDFKILAGEEWQKIFGNRIKTFW